MNRQLLTENPNTTFYDANQSVAGIEMHEINNTTNTTYRAGYVNLEDIDDNVFYADNNAQKKYQNLQSEDPLSHIDQQKIQNAQINNQQQDQIALKNGQVGLAQNQLANQQQIQYPQQVNNQQSAYPNMSNKNVVSSNNFQPQTHQFHLPQNQQFVAQQYQSVPSVYSSQLNNMYNQPPIQQQQQASYFGMGQMTNTEYQQQLHLQQKIYEDIQRQRMSQNQSQINRQSNVPSQLPLQMPQNPSQPQIPMQRSQPQIAQQEMIAKVDVKCIHCFVMQRIPMTSKKFQCFNCQKVQDSNPTIPIYSMFSCGKCQARVLYEPGVSDLICCTRCQTINKVSMDANLLKKQMNNQLDKILQNPIMKEQQKNQNQQPKDELSEDEIKQIEKQFSEISIKKDDQNQRSESFDVSQVQDEQFIQLQKKQLEQIELMKKQQQLLQQQIEQKQQAIKQQSVLQSQKPASPQVQPIIITSPEQSKYPILAQDDKQQNPQSINNQKDLLDLPQQPQQEQQSEIIQPQQSLNQQTQNQDMVQQNSSHSNQIQSNQEQNNSIFVDQNVQKNNDQHQINDNNNYSNQQLQQQQQYHQQQQQQQQHQQQVEEQQVQRNDRGFSIFEDHQINNCLL
ncbi:hypothetical protein TTHERM_00895680 (macronuclear) [Tetrahymena thermophila SB210]|uniref:Uncharacterized protein n=1 Tax=Tetrahymena thermophila (strain SB210) TaxID=312017 RepID=Q22E59_TETTS|nr:hypothetical protein TTHERM_00895680 [Tetrahymena thermophila SB210]EAR83555.2 hypothetical protein TTHERM_00895680 [Tetrahymena thermophila SB210]|eukprot:XP_001031218.2 hypothetical protein TTHERM_00895680 [Tetrahymena thermophila SB210]